MLYSSSYPVSGDIQSTILQQIFRGKRIHQLLSSLSGVVAFTGGNMHSVFLKSDGTVWTCGYNDQWQLGNGTYTISLEPVQTIDLCQTSINSVEVKEFNSFSVYPNPSDNLINIQIENNNKAALEIYSVYGKRICSKRLHSNT